MNRIYVQFAAAGFIAIAGCLARADETVIKASINIVRLSSDDQTTVRRLMEKLSPLIAERRQKNTLVTLSFEDLYAPLDKPEKDFLKRFQTIDPNLLELSIPYQGIPKETPELVVIKGQIIKTADNKTWTVPPQFLPKETYEAYQSMAEAMKKDIGKTLYVESGYRSAAYQLYLFISYLKNHNYSIRETARFSAWPGYSEHGWPPTQAIDFINEKGINQNNPKLFEGLEEYRWLLKNAAQYGFELSYPKDSGMTFEPWHWRYNNQLKKHD